MSSHPKNYYLQILSTCPKKLVKAAQVKSSLLSIFLLYIIVSSTVVLGN